MLMAITMVVCVIVRVMVQYAHCGAAPDTSISVSSRDRAPKDSLEDAHPIETHERPYQKRALPLFHL